VKASFVFMLSMACADVLHGLVTTTYLYPPIVLKVNDHIPPIAQRIIIAIDWTAWAITITYATALPTCWSPHLSRHMSAIALDRVVAVLIFARYMQIMTARRAKLFCMTCWSFFIALNGTFAIANFCCLIVPLPESDFYSFGYDPPR
jgi:hypothetical protein